MHANTTSMACIALLFSSETGVNNASMTHLYIYKLLNNNNLCLQKISARHYMPCLVAW